MPPPPHSPHSYPAPRRGPTLQEVLDEGEFELQPLPSDEAWFGEPDPAVYAAGTNDLTKEQLQQEVAKGNVCTLRQLKQHLLTASEDELEVRGRRRGGGVICAERGGSVGRSEGQDLMAQREWRQKHTCRGTAATQHGAPSLHCTCV